MDGYSLQADRAAEGRECRASSSPLVWRREERRASRATCLPVRAAFAVLILNWGCSRGLRRAGVVREHVEVWRSRRRSTPTWIPVWTAPTALDDLGCRTRFTISRRTGQHYRIPAKGSRAAPQGVFDFEIRHPALPLRSKPEQRREPRARQEPPSSSRPRGRPLSHPRNDGVGFTRESSGAGDEAWSGLECASAPRSWGAAEVDPNRRGTMSSSAPRRPARRACA